MNEISTKREELGKGCGYMDNSWKSSKCTKHNLCIECWQRLLDFDKGVEMARKEIIITIQSILNENLEAYPRYKFLELLQIIEQSLEDKKA